MTNDAPTSTEPQSTPKKHSWLLWACLGILIVSLSYDIWNRHSRPTPSAGTLTFVIYATPANFYTSALTVFLFDDAKDNHTKYQVAKGTFPTTQVIEVARDIDSVYIFANAIEQLDCAINWRGDDGKYEAYTQHSSTRHSVQGIAVGDISDVTVLPKCYWRRWYSNTDE